MESLRDEMREVTREVPREVIVRGGETEGWENGGGDKDGCEKGESERRR